MPEVNHTMSSAAGEPGTEHHVSTILQDWSYKDRIFFRVILQVRILNDDQVASSCLKTRTQRCSLPEIAFLQHQFVDPSRRLSLKEFFCSISGSVVDDDNFNFLDRCRAYCFNHSLNRWPLVVTGDYHRELHRPITLTGVMRSPGLAQMHSLLMS